MASLQSIMSTVDVFAQEVVGSKQVTLVEDVLCQFLEWRLVVPTPAEILKSLLYFANTEYDFSVVLQKCTDNVLIFYIAYTGRLYRYSSVALASLLVALYQL